MQDAHREAYEDMAKKALFPPFVRFAVNRYP